jgi:hypothetical protein
MLPDQMRRKSETLRHNNSERALTATRDEPDAVAVRPSVAAMPGSDLQLARILLDGDVDQDRRRRVRSRYLKEGSKQELDARRAIARLLRSDSPLDRDLRTALAGLFDPDPPAWEQRKITIVSRRRGRRVDHVSNTQLAEHVREKVSAGATVTAAIGSAVEAFSVDEDTVKKIWGKYRPIFERVYGRLPRPGRRSRSPV